MKRRDALRIATPRILGRRPASRWAAWARSVADRYGRVAAFDRRPGRLRPPGVAIRGATYAPTAASLRLHLDVGMMTQTVMTHQTALKWAESRRQRPQPFVPAPAPLPTRRTGVGPAVPAPPAVLRADPPRPVLVPVVAAARQAAARPAAAAAEPLAVRGVSAPLTRATVHRITHEHLRVEERPRPPAVAEPGAAGAWGRTPPPQPLTAPAAPRRAAAPAAETMPAGAGRGRSDARPEPPAIDLQRLTEQVVRQIDQRVVALRERMGRGV